MNHECHMVTSNCDPVPWIFAQFRNFRPFFMEISEHTHTLMSCTWLKPFKQVLQPPRISNNLMLASLDYFLWGEICDSWKYLLIGILDSNSLILSWMSKIIREFRVIFLQPDKSKWINFGCSVILYWIWKILMIRSQSYVKTSKISK